MKVACMQTSDGTVTSARIHVNLNGGGDHIKLNILSDNSGYFITPWQNYSNYAHLCKYIFSAASAQ